MKFDYVGGRTFLLVLLAGAACFILVWAGKIAGAEFIAALGITLGPYIAANAVQGHTDARAEAQIEIAKLQAATIPSSTVEQVSK